MSLRKNLCFPQQPPQKLTVQTIDFIGINRVSTVFTVFTEGGMCISKKQLLWGGSRNNYKNSGKTHKPLHNIGKTGVVFTEDDAETSVFTEGANHE